MLENIVILIFIQDRKNVLACHKAGVMKMGDGLFIQIAAEVAKKYPEIQYD
jgi:isocitrate dehydrogenase (NAD+)